MTTIGCGNPRCCLCGVCDNCGGELVSEIGTGREMSGRGQRPFTVPADLVLHKCKACGDILLDGETMDALGRAERAQHGED